VKKHESGVVAEPITISPSMTIQQVHDLTAQHGISGLPVVEGEQLVGIVTRRDIRFEKSLDRKVSDIMTPRERLVTVSEHSPREAAIEQLHQHRIEKVLVVNDAFELRGMITVKDIQSYRHR